MAMGPRFMNPLFFHCDGSLEVCGPTGFGPDDVLLEITSLTVSQNGTTMSPPHFPIIATRSDIEWETEIPNAKGTFSVGPATGSAIAYLIKQNGQRRQISWPGSFTIEDGCGILEELDSEAAAIYREGGRDDPA